MYVYIYIYGTDKTPPHRFLPGNTLTTLTFLVEFETLGGSSNNGYSAQWVPLLSPVGSFGTCLKYAVPKGTWYVSLED